MARFTLYCGHNDAYSGLVKFAQALYPPDKPNPHICEGYTSNSDLNTAFRYLSGSPAGDGLHIRDFFKILIAKEIGNNLLLNKPIDMELVRKLKHDDAMVWRACNVKQLTY